MNNNGSHRRWLYVVLSLTLVDALALTGAFFLAFWLRISSGLLYYGVEADLDSYIRLYVLSAPIFLLVFYALRLYDPDDLFYGTMEYVLVTKAASYGVIAVIVLGFFHRPTFSRGWVFLFWILSVLVFNLGRFAFRRLIRRRFRAGFGHDRVLIIGVNEEARTIAKRLIETGRMEVMGFLDDFGPVGQEVIQGIRVVGAPYDYEKIARTEGVTHIIVVPGAAGWETIQELLLAATKQNGLHISLSPGLGELSASLRVSYVGYIPLLRFRPGYTNIPDKLLKAGLDLVLGICLMVLSLPVMIAVTLWILWQNGRPILAKEEVLGSFGVPFKVFAFRIAQDKAVLRCFPDTREEASNQTNEKPRLANFLSSCGVYKLPQLFNVIMGQMSLVGPRPIPKEREHQYGIWSASMLTVKPGMTGPWAIQKTRNLELEMSQSVSYINTWTPLKDLHYIMHTVFNILQICMPARVSNKSWNAMRRKNDSATPKGTSPRATECTPLAHENKAYPEQ